MRFSRLIYRMSAVQRMAHCNISAAEVRYVLATERVIENYPQGYTLSQLTHAWMDGHSPAARRDS